MNSTLKYLLFVLMIFLARASNKPAACGTPEYHHDETKNVQGPYKCSTICDCDGQRTCSSFHYCQPQPPTLACGTTTYIHDESKNLLGSNKCANNCDCDGQRTCSNFGWCQGVSRPSH